ncbi:hypothetical protein EQ718_06180 [Paracoccus versutus]|nr:hypothetical protein IT40_03740 [Paracoccus versutus]WEJ78498.1 hypothetical protein EQ718_06180 [Paracoccus versutus]
MCSRLPDFPNVWRRAVDAARKGQRARDFIFDGAAASIIFTEIRRQCTSSYKIVPIRRKVRELLGIAERRSPGSPIAEQWIGISLDEALCQSACKAGSDSISVQLCGHHAAPRSRALSGGQPSFGAITL